MVTHRSDRPARVALVVDGVLPWSKGGRETMYDALVPRWEAAGHEVTVYTMRWWDDEPP